MSLFHTDKGPLEDKIKRVEAIIDKGLIVNWRVSATQVEMSRSCHIYDHVFTYSCISRNTISISRNISIQEIPAA